MDSAAGAAPPEPLPAPGSGLRAHRLRHTAERLGQGSFADVYRGTYEFASGAPEAVALKVFRADL